MERKMKRYDIVILMRDNITMKFNNARYTEESWCVRIDTDEGITRVNKNGINNIKLKVSE